MVLSDESLRTGGDDRVVDIQKVALGTRVFGGLVAVEDVGLDGFDAVQGG